MVDSMHPQMDRSRQLGLFRPEQATTPITIIGAGGIGSFTAFSLAKMGVLEMTVYDPDIVEDVNPANQLYRPQDIGKKKVDALAEICKDFSDCQIKAVAERYIDQPLAGLVISAVDSMVERKKIWEAGLKFNPNVDLYIDGRTGGLFFHIVSVIPHKPDDIRFYETQLFPPEKIADLPCTERSIVFTLFGIASEISSLVREWWVKNEKERSLRKDFESHAILIS